MPFGWSRCWTLHTITRRQPRDESGQPSSWWLPYRHRLSRNEVRSITQGHCQWHNDTRSSKNQISKQTSRSSKAMESDLRDTFLKKHLTQYLYFGLSSYMFAGTMEEVYSCVHLCVTRSVWVCACVRIWVGGEGVLAEILHIVVTSCANRIGMGIFDQIDQICQRFKIENIIRTIIWYIKW